MPATSFRPERLSVYLDTSTLSYAVRGATIGASREDREFRSLFSLVESVARDCNLVFSHTHLTELAAWQDPAAGALTSWLDGLSLVWARFWPHTLREEDDYWVRVVADGVPADPVKFCAPSMLSTFEEMSFKASIGILEDATLVKVWEREKESPELFVQERTTALQWAEGFNLNRRAFGWPNMTKAQLAALDADVAYRERVELRKRAAAAHDRLSNQQSGYTGTLNSVVDPFVEQYSSDPRSMPMTKVQAAVIEGFAGTATARTVGSKGFGKLESSVADMFHALVGAAYCDVFTCDALTRDWLGDVRQRLGFGPAIVYSSGDATAFIRELEAALAQAKGGVV